MKNRPGQNFKMKSLEELLGVVNEESAMDIEIDKISAFSDHPFKVLDDEKMDELVESIKANGVLSPVLIRPKGLDTYEMVSGHRRLHAAQIAGLTAIPAIIREMSDDDAVITMVDANIQREELLPSEKAFAYKMKKEALSHQGRRNDLTLGQNVSKFKRTTEEIASGTGESYKQIQRYIRLTELIPELLKYVDQRKIQFTVAVESSFLNKEIQKWLYEYIKENGNVKPKQISILREACSSGIMTQAKLISLLNDSQPGRLPSSKSLLSEKKLRQYFPEDYTPAQMRSVIIALLESWQRG